MLLNYSKMKKASLIQLIEAMAEKQNVARKAIVILATECNKYRSVKQIPNVDLNKLKDVAVAALNTSK